MTKTTKFCCLVVLCFTVANLVAFDFFRSSVKKESNGPGTLWMDKNEEQINSIKLPSLNPIIAEVEPAVLIVTTEMKAVQRNFGNNLPPELENSPFGDFFKFFGPNAAPKAPVRKGQGSGFIIHPDGYALTNNHVVEGASKILVKVGSELEEYEAEIIGTDKRTDIALIKLKSKLKKKWPFMHLGNSAKAKVGDFVLAIGNPFGLELSASTGIVSARRRRSVQPGGQNGLFDFIQTDAPINFGNSGGPLLNLNGEVIGINTAINAAGQGLSFSIPINMVKTILPQLKEKGKVIPSWIGVIIEDVSSQLAKAIGMKHPYGALIREVVPGSPGEKSGLRPGDIVIKFNNELIRNRNDLPVIAGMSPVQIPMPITIFRNGQKMEKTITLEKMPGDKDAYRSSNENISIEELGLAIGTLSDSKRNKLKIKNKLQGAIIKSVVPRSIAHQYGIKVDDVIFSINGQSITNAEELASYINKAKSGSVLRMLVQRGNTTFFVAPIKP